MQQVPDQEPEKVVSPLTNRERITFSIDTALGYAFALSSIQALINESVFYDDAETWLRSLLDAGVPPWVFTSAMITISIALFTHKLERKAEVTATVGKELIAKIRQRLQGNTNQEN